MRSDLILSARIESIVWEALAENDLHMRLSAREKLAAELVALVRDQQTEAWDEGNDAGWTEANAHHENAATYPKLTITNPYRKGTNA